MRVTVWAASAWPAASQVTVTARLPGAAISAVRVRSAASVPLATAAAAGLAVHAAVEGATVKLSATVIVPVPAAVVSARPLVSTLFS